MLDRALEEAGIDRAQVYVTNAVKHFKNEPRGKRRIHKKPDTRRDRRLPLVARQRDRADRSPRVVVALGATAARASAQGAHHQRQSRAPHRPSERVQGLITVHPSYLLRLQEERDKRREFDLLVKDLRLAPEAARHGATELAHTCASRRSSNCLR